MKFKLGFLNNYITKKKDRDDKQLIPTRRPAVRLNLKGVKVSNKKFVNTEAKTVESKKVEEEVVSNKLNLIPQEVKKDNKKIKKDQLKSKGFKFPDNFGFFNKSNFDSIVNNKNRERLDEGYLKKEVSKKSGRFGLWFLIFSIFLLIIVIVYFFYTATVNAGNEDLAKCRTELASAVSKGVRTDDLNCGGLGFLNLPANSEKYDEIYIKIVDREQENISEIEELDQTIQQKIDSLAIFGEEYEPEVVTDKNYLTVKSKKQEEISKLDKMLGEKKTIIFEFEKNFEFLLSLSGDAPVDEEVKFFEEFQSLTDSKKFENFSVFKDTFASLQDKLQFQISEQNQYATSAFSDPEFFNFKIFTAQELVEVFDNKKLPNTADTTDRLSLTGSITADNKIYSIAEGRGYTLRAVAIESKLVDLEGQQVQSEIVDSYLAMKQAASEDGVNLSLVSGYRSPTDQQGIFTSRFSAQSIADNGEEYSSEEITSGNADDSIDKVLQQSSVPGYSKHHSGYTIDINEAGQSALTTFGDTEAFKWISANNYYNAKRFGFVPSYPEGGENFGPDPEAWEYVWVGVDLLRN